MEFLPVFVILFFGLVSLILIQVYPAAALAILIIQVVIQVSIMIGTFFGTRY